VPLAIEPRATYQQASVFDSVLDLLSVESPQLEHGHGFIVAGSVTQAPRTGPGTQLRLSFP
jgi:hypothetical protein